jgi:pimeloyl-ACP methyl ester carboxylesterase
MLLVGCAFAIFVLATVDAKAEWPGMTRSADGVPISYEVHGAGEPALVFVHGWSCDSRYWRKQIPHFSRNHLVAVLDLAGHGHSGMSRADYTMRSFGEDVKAVVEELDSAQVILVGHSMGGPVIVEAARLLPNRVIGLIPVDTLENIEFPLKQEQFEAMLAPLKTNFQAESRKFVEPMITAASDSGLREWILSDMSSASPVVALSAIRGMMTQYITGEAARLFEQMRLPVVAVNADLWPTEYEINRKHMASFDAIILKGSDHFLMMNRPEEFNKALEQAIRMLTTKESRTP